MRQGQQLLICPKERRRYLIFWGACRVASTWTDHSEACGSSQRPIASTSKESLSVLGPLLVLLITSVFPGGQVEEAGLGGRCSSQRLKGPRMEVLFPGSGESLSGKGPQAGSPWLCCLLYAQKPARGGALGLRSCIHHALCVFRQVMFFLVEASHSSIQQICLECHLYSRLCPCHYKCKQMA